MAAAAIRFIHCIEYIRQLVSQLPETVPTTTKDDHVFEVFKLIPWTPENIGDTWEIFNRRMVILFGETPVSRWTHWTTLPNLVYVVTSRGQA
ncbi:hypothetical protein BDQ12DRAFT_444506 [Crucibulum laeve]|uniref:Uncharacterized protein n=1 Tax=Crucibulum laeve TaxID=68775 RepID=A0A5C3LKB7_9AGAR|nr:hypothetical protein BDQ12DRAFT_444506 [Crucibulum laeve]